MVVMIPLIPCKTTDEHKTATNSDGPFVVDDIEPRYLVILRPRTWS
jgi:hypothetical protein